MSNPSNEARAAMPGVPLDPSRQGMLPPMAAARSVRVLQALVAAASAAGGLALAANHPLGAVGACLLFSAVAAGTLAWPHAWLWALPAAIPVTGLAPWSGWITFEELDLLVLGIAAGGYARKALEARPQAAATSLFPKFGVAGGVLVALFAVSIGISLVRGTADAGGFRFGWFQGYADPMNSIRLAKSFVLALLVWPLWRDAERGRPVEACTRWMAGWCLGLAGASLAALWERLAFTGLLDFSTDYRTTALFWEMHVGGAAFDGFLALTMPFALGVLTRTSAPARWLGSLLVVLIGSYACLTTFSRGVFVAIPVGALVMAVLTLRQRARRNAVPVRNAALGRPVLMLAAYALAAAWVFPYAGYRGMLALLGSVAVLLRLGADGSTERRVLAGIVAALLMSVIVVLASTHWDKGAYIAYAAMLALALVSTALPPMRWLASAAFVALIVSFGAVCRHWGGDGALLHAVPVGLVLLLAGLARAHGPAAQAVPWRNQAALVACAIATSAAVGVLAGGSYMSGRMSTAGDDFRGRVAHWREGLGLLHSPAQRAFGIGLGRYPAAFFSLHGATDAPGEYVLRDDPQGRILAMSAGQHELGWGEFLRLSQRIRLPHQPVTVAFAMRGARTLSVHVEVCEKHLLYNGNCMIAQATRPASGQSWTPVHERLEGPAVSRGAFYAPRMLVFSIGNVARGSVVEIRDLQLLDADGSDLLTNADFSRELAGWLFSSDRNHLPWHLKNIFVNVLFDQGGFGLSVFVALLFAALWQLVAGSAREHPLAPAVAASLVGFLVVGLFDSLLDVPRDAFIFHLLLLQSLTLRGPRCR